MSSWRPLDAAGFQPAYASLPVAGEPQDLSANDSIHEKTLLCQALSEMF